MPDLHEYATPQPAATRLDGKGCFLLTRRAPETGRVSVASAVLLVWTPTAGAFRPAGGSERRLRAGQYALVTGIDEIVLMPAADQGLVHALGVSKALLGDIATELQAVSKSRIPLAGLLHDARERPRTGVQPDSLVGLLGDLDQAAALGMRDPAWLRRHVKLVWERLIFTRILLSHGRRSPPARPRPSPRRAGLEQRLRRVRRLLETEYQRPLDLAEMAAQACVSRYHFLREFRKAFGRTPYQQLIEIRLRAARRLLRSGDLPVQEVSRRVGFASTDGFYRAFRKRYHRSPSSFRARP
jgi:AraC-like DNA-binding protein